MDDLTIQPGDRLLRIRDVQAIIPFSVVTINRMEADGRWPRRIRLGTKVFWVEREIRAHLDQQRTEAGKPQAKAANPNNMEAARVGRAKARAAAKEYA